MRQREQAGRPEAAEQAARQAPASQRSGVLHRLAQDRAGEQVMPLFRRAYEEALVWAPGLLAARLEA
ncbi:hypothetical protein ACIRU3_39685 [Streptomyces sp. NPDC101151]|uniref:hypothetical protein n=1 Tax=Streptomyces sp. NPDC101151 TaxID=3366115 RepID=UPI0037F1A3C2